VRIFALREHISHFLLLLPFSSELHSSTGAEGISSLDNGTKNESLSTLWSTLAKFFVFRLDNGQPPYSTEKSNNVKLPTDRIPSEFLTGKNLADE
jgi:hypothetical protein